MSINIEEVQTGISLLDRQHEKYYNTVKKVFELCEEENISEQELQDILLRIKEYAVDNFDTEEYLMTLEEYPAFDEHRTKHEYFKDRLDGFTSRLNADKEIADSRTLADELSTLLVDWFNEQIKHDDMELAGFLKERNA